MTGSATQTYAEWHDRNPSGVREVKARVGAPTLLGTATEILYVSDKWGPKGAKTHRYVHPFDTAVKFYEGRPSRPKRLAEMGRVEYLDFDGLKGPMTMDFEKSGRMPVLAGAETHRRNADGSVTITAVLVLIDDRTGRCWTLKGGKLRITPEGITG